MMLYAMQDPIICIAFSVMLVKERAFRVCQSWMWNPAPLVTNRPSPWPNISQYFRYISINLIKLSQTLSGPKTKEKTLFIMWPWVILLISLSLSFFTCKVEITVQTPVGYILISNLTTEIIQEIEASGDDKNEAECKLPKCLEWDTQSFPMNPPSLLIFSSLSVSNRKKSNLISTSSLYLPSVPCLFQLFTETNASSHSYVQTGDINIKKGRSLTRRHTLSLMWRNKNI